MMTPNLLTEDEEDQIKYLLLSEEEEDRRDAANLLFKILGAKIMGTIEYHHPGLSEADREEVLLSAIDRFAENFRFDLNKADRPLEPQLLRTTFFVGRERYRKVSRRQGPIHDALIRAITETLRNSEFGRTWNDVTNNSFRERVGNKIRETAASMSPRQRQIAMMLAETWGLEFSEREAIAELFLTSGERLTRDAFKRALSEVRQKLREPILKILMEEGLCPKTLCKTN
jgi:hypothetical protein